MIKFGDRIQLRCRECGRAYPPSRLYVCTECFGPLEVVYDYERVALSRDVFAWRSKTLWRYRELLPVLDKNRIVDLGAGYTPLHRSHKLGKLLGLKNLYLKDDTCNPTNSFKDRPASIAVSKALELGFDAVGCASTGNLAAATAAHAARAAVGCYILIPHDIEPAKISQTSLYGARIIAVKGTYDDANRLANQAAEEYNWAIVNVNIRPYYVEGSKTLAFEVCEQLGWKTPDRVIVPTASGALLCAIRKGFTELSTVGLIDDGRVKMCAAQPKNCNPVVAAFKSGQSEITPIERPETIAKSLAIGEPADGIYAVKAMRETGGRGEDASEEEILEAVELLARTEGIFAEPGGGVAVAALKKLADSGEIDPEETVVCYITGSGLKAVEAFASRVPRLNPIEPSLGALSAVVSN